MDKTLERTLKEGMNTKLSTCDDKGVFTDDDDKVKTTQSLYKVRWIDSNSQDHVRSHRREKMRSWKS